MSASTLIIEMRVSLVFVKYLVLFERLQPNKYTLQSFQLPDREEYPTIRLAIGPSGIGIHQGCSYSMVIHHMATL